MTVKLSRYADELNDAWSKAVIESRKELSKQYPAIWGVSVCQENTKIDINWEFEKDKR